MASEFIEDTRFEQIMQMEGIDLDEFQQQTPNTDLFINAQTYPDFFNQNLVSPNRVLKEFLNNPQSNIRIFYLQLLRLGYEIQSQGNSNRNFILNLKRIVFHPQFEILFTPSTQDQRDLFNDFQFKRLFAQFIILLDNQQLPNVQQIVCHYSIMDTIFIHIFRSLLASQNINEQFDVAIPSQIVFSQLSNLLGLTVTSYGNCWKFQDSDMFCYEQGQNNLYLAYIADDGQVQEYQGQIPQQQVNTQQNNFENNQTRQQNQNIQYNNYNNNIQTHNQYSNSYEPQIHNKDFQRVQSIYQPEKYSNNVTITNNRDEYTNNYDINLINQNKNSSQDYQQKNYGSLNYNSNSYFSNNEINISQPKTQFVSSYKAPQYRSKYQPVHQTSYKPYGSSYLNQVKSSQHQSNYTSSFKPVDLTPVPTFDGYKSSYEIKKQYTKPVSSYESSYQNKRYEAPTSFSSGVFESNIYQSSNNYKPTYTPSFQKGGGDYSKDFTSPQILAKLRPGHRDNITKIRQSMKGMTRGGQLPTNFDLKKSAVYDNGYNNQINNRTASRSQFEYSQYRPLQTNSSYSSYKPQTSYNNYTSSYSSY